MHAFDVENHAGDPVYVHAKVCVVDDVWASIGSDNFNRRSWTHDSELSCAVLDETRDEREPRDPANLGDGARRYARDLRLTLMREHLDRAPGDDTDLLDPASAVRALGAAADTPRRLACSRPAQTAPTRPAASAPTRTDVPVHPGVGRDAVPDSVRPGRTTTPDAPCGYLVSAK